MIQNHKNAVIELDVLEYYPGYDGPRGKYHPCMVCDTGVIPGLRSSSPPYRVLHDQNCIGCGQRYYFKDLSRYNLREVLSEPVKVEEPKVWLDHAPSFPSKDDPKKYTSRIDMGRMKAVICPMCKSAQDGWCGIGGPIDSIEMPKTGAIIVCGDCGSVNVLAENHVLVAMESDELEELVKSSGMEILELLVQMGHLRGAKKQLTALIERRRKWGKSGTDEDTIKELFGVDAPKGSMLAILTEWELKSVRDEMIASGNHRIGNLTLEMIDSVFSKAGIKP